ARLLAFHICSADDQSTLSVGKFIRNVSAMCSKNLPAYDKLLTKELRESLGEQNCQLNPVSAFKSAVLSPLSKLSASDLKASQRSKADAADSKEPASAAVWCLVVDSLDESLFEKQGM